MGQCPQCEDGDKAHLLQLAAMLTPSKGMRCSYDGGFIQRLEFDTIAQNLIITLRKIRREMNRGQTGVEVR
jgi:hypothetical protein